VVDFQTYSAPPVIDSTLDLWSISSWEAGVWSIPAEAKEESDIHRKPGSVVDSTHGV
jgi:hypothetical protein